MNDGYRFVSGVCLIVLGAAALLLGHGLIQMIGAVVGVLGLGITAYVVSGGYFNW